MSVVEVDDIGTKWWRDPDGKRFPCGIEQFAYDPTRRALECNHAALWSVVEVDAWGTKRWYDPNGELHRVDGPAKECPDGSKWWYRNGKLHRVDGPAIKCPYGHEEWYLHGKRHRVDGPAEEWSDGSTYWYLHGKRHRVDGPAVERDDGIKKWYFEGHEIAEAQSEFIQRMHQKAFHHKFKLLRYWMIRRLHDPRTASGRKRMEESWESICELVAEMCK
jgi:hypothetical protein